MWRELKTGRSVTAPVPDPTRRPARAHIRLLQPVKQAWKTNLIEEEPEPLPVSSSGSVELDVRPWEIVTLKLAV